MQECLPCVTHRGAARHSRSMYGGCLRGVMEPGVSLDGVRRPAATAKSLCTSLHQMPPGKRRRVCRLLAGSHSSARFLPCSQGHLPRRNGRPTDGQRETGEGDRLRPLIDSSRGHHGSAAYGVFPSFAPADVWPRCRQMPTSHRRDETVPMTIGAYGAPPAGQTASPSTEYDSR